MELARGCDAVCVFVNDTVNAAVIERLHDLGVKLIALRSAGYNNVDVQAAFGKVHVVHVPAYSPYAVAEHAMALLEGIKARRIGAACLDVYEEEADVFFEDRSGHILNDDLLSRLISMPNVIVTSHQAFLTEEALNNIAETTVGNILSCFENDGICDNELCYRCGSIERCKKERRERCF